MQGMQPIFVNNFPHSVSTKIAINGICLPPTLVILLAKALWLSHPTRSELFLLIGSFFIFILNFYKKFRELLASKRFTELLDVLGLSNVSSDEKFALMSKMNVWLFLLFFIYFL